MYVCVCTYHFISFAYIQCLCHRKQCFGVPVVILLKITKFLCIMNPNPFVKVWMSFDLRACRQWACQKTGTIQYYTRSLIQINIVNTRLLVIKHLCIQFKYRITEMKSVFGVGNTCVLFRIFGTNAFKNNKSMDCSHSCNLKYFSQSNQ